MGRPIVTDHGYNPKEEGLINPIKAVEDKESDSTKSSNKKKK